MSDQPFTARNVAKFLVTSIVASKTSDLAAEALTDYTSLEEDSLAVSLGSKCIGWGFSSKVKPYTDAAVDKTADFVATKRANRKAKKTDNTETE